MKSFQAPIPVPIHTWKKSRRGRFVPRRDAIRDLLVVEHPWAPSRQRGFGQWETEVSPPAGWRPGRPLFVSFYQSDNYSGAWPKYPGQGAQRFIGHRFKQLLVNGKVAWEQDVADEELFGVVNQSYTAMSVKSGQSGFTVPTRVVDISRFAGPRLRLAFRVLDKVASTRVMPGDAYRRWSWGKINPDLARKNFQTTVTFGDLFLAPTSRAVRPAPAFAAQQQTPAPGARNRGPRGAIPGSGIPLDLAIAGALPAPGFPVSSGVPLPQGAVRPGTTFALDGPGGVPVPLATRELGLWPDGSLRWLLCQFVAGRAGRYHLRPGAAPRAPAAPVRIAARNGRVAVSNGVLALKIGPSRGQGAWESLAAAGGLTLGAMEFSIKLNRVGCLQPFRARRRRIRVEERGPVCATLRVEGDLLDADGRRFGPWFARLRVWAGLPCVFVEWRIVNETDQAMAMLLDWSANIRLPGLEGAVVDFGPFTPGYDPGDIRIIAAGGGGTVTAPRRLHLHKDSQLGAWQETAEQGRLYQNISWVASTPRAAGFVNVNRSGGGIAAAMRWFAEEYPKGILLQPDALTLATMPSSEPVLSWFHDRPSARIGRGEAKTQVFALWLHGGVLPPVQAERFNRCVQDPPRLFNRDWFLASEALETGVARNRPEIRAWAQTVTPELERSGIGAKRLGHREYWDTAWSNDYRGRIHLGALQCVETGDPRWFRYVEAASAHHRDVDIIHFCPEHPDWVGSSHDIGQDHTSAGPSVHISMNCESLLDHYLLTGDPESLAAARAQAEPLLSLDPWHRCARVIGWPLAQTARWYEHTGDPRFLRKAREFMEAVSAYVEPRRGIFVEFHGTWNYRGIVPFMTGYLVFGLIRHHRITHDVRALNLLRSLAAGLWAEARTGPGRFRYSPCPENDRPGSRSWTAHAGGLAGYLYLATGERRYARWARECYAAIVEKANDAQVSLDQMQTAGWLLRAVAASGPARRL